MLLRLTKTLDSYEMQAKRAAAESAAAAERAAREAEEARSNAVAAFVKRRRLALLRSTLAAWDQAAEVRSSSRRRAWLMFNCSSVVTGGRVASIAHKPWRAASDTV